MNNLNAFRRAAMLAATQATGGLRAWLLACMLPLLALGLHGCGGGGGATVVPVAISAQPTSANTTAGTGASFSITATGDGLSFQWQLSVDGGVTWTAIAGATSATYAVTAVTPAMSGQEFRVVVTGVSGSLTSSAVTLTVAPVVVAVAISVQPANQTATAGGNVSFSVTAAGTSPTYQWQISSDGSTWSDLAGATNATVVLEAVATTASGTHYRVLISNSAGSVTSAAVTLTVNAAAPAPSISAQPAAVAVVAGQFATFTVTANSLQAVTYQWQSSTNGGASFVDIPGATGASYVTPAAVVQDNGTVIRVMVSNSGGSVTSASATLTVAAAAVAPAITTQPTNQTVGAPLSATFTVIASGTPAPTYQWQLSTDGGLTFANINGATESSYTTPATTLSDNGKLYKVLVSNQAGTVSSASGQLTVKLTGQGAALTLTGKVSTVAGSDGTFVETDGIGRAASFNIATGVATDGTSLYVTDYAGGTIRKVSTATGAVTTLAGSGKAAEVDGVGTAASFNGPLGIAIVGSNLYVADRDGATIRQVSIATGAVTTLAGSGSTGWTDGAGRAATFFLPAGIATDGTNLYVADMGNCRIRKVTIAGAYVTTFSGAPGFPNCVEVDGNANTATFHLPYGIAFDGGNLYVVDTDGASADDGGTIRRIVISSGEVTTIAGSRAHGGTAVDGIGGAATFLVPHGIAVSGDYLYVTDWEAIRQISITTGTVTTLAGSIYEWAEKDGIGASARFMAPNGMAIAGGVLYVADSGAIRTVAVASATVATLAGGGNGVADIDGIGSAATLSGPVAVTTDGTSLYVADSTAHKIRRIVIATGAVTTLAGSGSAAEADGTGAAASFNSPTGITTDGVNLYVADSDGNTVRKIVIATGAVTTLAGWGIPGEIDGRGRAAAFNHPTGVATDGRNVYVVDQVGRTLRQIVIATGAVTTLAGNGLQAETDGIGSAASFPSPTGIVTDGVNLYVTDSSGAWIRKVVIASGAVTTLPNTLYNDPNRASPGLAGIATDGANLYVCNPGDGLVSQIVIATGVQTLLAGSGRAAEADGVGNAASFNGPSGIATDGQALYVTDLKGNRIRKIN